MLNQIMRVFALLIALTSFIVSFAQSDDGTLLSPNLPLPSPLNLLPIGLKPQATPAPISAQPAPAPAPAATPVPPVAIAKPIVAPSTSSPASSPITAPRPVTTPTAEPTNKPIEAPVGLVMPIVVGTNIPKPITSTPTPPRVIVSVAPKPAAQPITAKPTPKPAAKPVTAKPVAVKPAPKPAAAKPTPKPVVRASSTRALMVITAKSTAYNSLAAQTDSTPFVTATGARTRFGVVALSRDLLRRIPYGSIVRIEDLGSWANGRGRGTYNRMLSGVNFIVEDTMNIRKRNTVDVWMPSRRAAIQWGARQIRVTVIRLGRR